MRREGSHTGAMVFVGVVGVILFVVFSLRGGGTPAAQPTPTPTATAPLPKLADLDSAWVDQTPPAQIAVGAEATITFKFRNAGRAAWTRGTGSEASLAFTGTAAKFDPKMAVNWPAASTAALTVPSTVKCQMSCHVGGGRDPASPALSKRYNPADPKTSIPRTPPRIAR